MRLVEEFESPEDHFTEGEPDLEPPEELAVAELDDDALLEEELDNDGDAEVDVDEVALELTLEDLVHSADAYDADGELFEVAPMAPIEGRGVLKVPEGAGSDGLSMPPGKLNGNGKQSTRGRATMRTASGNESEEELELEDLEVVDLEDVEESLDRILAERLAGDADASAEEEGDEEEEPPVAGVLPVSLHPAGGDWNGVTPCREDEFVCASCFLVKNQVQLADAARKICRDCSG